MPKLNGKVPKYRKHKASGQGIVTLNGQDVYCGPFEAPASKAKYDRLIAEWLSNGRCRIRSDSPEEIEAAISVNELVVAFWNHAETYYRRPDGTQTHEIETLRQAVRPLVDLYGAVPVDQFGPRSLKAVREQMVQCGWCRPHINKQISRLKSIFRWGTEEELVPGSVHYALRAVRGLKKGRTKAREPDAVRPVPESMIEGIKPFVSDIVWSMIRLQLLTGARPGEITRMRQQDLDTTTDVWAYAPEGHKTAHHGHRRVIYMGPEAQQIIKPFLTPDCVRGYLFSPAESDRQMRLRRRRRRKTPISCGNRAGTNVKKSPRTKAGEYYEVAAYRRMITRACDQAFPPPAKLRCRKVPGKKGLRRETYAEWKRRLGPAKWAALQKWQREHRWHPHQLRHNAATRIRREHGIDAARAVLGHRGLAVTDVYAEIDANLAVQIARQTG